MSFSFGARPPDRCYVSLVECRYCQEYPISTQKTTFHKKWFLEHSRRISGEKAWMYVRVEDRGLESKRLVACCSHVRTKCHELRLNLEDFLPGEMVSHSVWRITGATQNSLRHTQAWSLIVSSLLRFKISNRHVHFALTTLGIRPWVFRCRIHFHSSKDNTDWVWALWQRIAADLVGAVS